MQETNTSNNFLQNGIKHLFAEVGKKTHLDEESLNDWIKVEIQGLIAEAYKKNVPKVLNWVGKNVKLKSKQKKC